LLQAPEPPNPPTLLATLVNDITALLEPFILVLDDYHLIEATAVDQILSFLLTHHPPHMHLVIATREDPPFPLPLLRARSQVTELRATDLRFTHDEAATFLNEVMKLALTEDDIAALEMRTEGWIAGLQLAALSMQGQGQTDAHAFIESFTGSHHFVLDYLLQEVLHKQTADVQTFLLRTSILERLCGPLCEAVVGDTAVSGPETLVSLEQANLFLVPLDNERRWYRYHHLFADLLRQRLAAQEGGEALAVYHRRASHWYEENGLALDAFHHATAVPDLDLATRLLVGDWMPLHFQSSVAPVLNWLASLPTAVLDERPVLWVMYASALSMTGQLEPVEPKLQAAEAALAALPPDEAHTRNLIGHIAAIRALLAAVQQDTVAIIAQSRRALDYLHPDNLAVRTATTWKLGMAYQFQGERSAALQAYRQAVASSRASGNRIIHLAATLGLALVEEAENQLLAAAESYRQVLALTNHQPQPPACEALLGLARLHYEWNEVETAREVGQQSLQMAQRIENHDRVLGAELFLAHLSLNTSEEALTKTAVVVSRIMQTVQQEGFAYLRAEATAVQIQLLLQQGQYTAAAELAAQSNLPLCLARVQLAQNDPTAVLTTLEPVYQQAQTRGWADQKLKVLLLQTLAYQQQGETLLARQQLSEALALGEPGGLVRTFVDEGPPLATLLSSFKDSHANGYIAQLLDAFDSLGELGNPIDSLVEPLSERELEILTLIAQGLSNKEIGERLFIALSTVKGHNGNIFGKLQAQNRTEAVARARELGLLV
jgi:LuxR family maltose regulon positive regulatory protein